MKDIAYPLEIEQEDMNALTVRDAGGDIIFEVVFDDKDEVPLEMKQMYVGMVALLNDLPHVEEALTDCDIEWTPGIPLSARIHGLVNSHKLAHALSTHGEPKDCEYQALANFLSDLPMTWYPALILTMVEAAYRKNVFKKNGCSKTIKDLEDKLDDE